MDKTYPLRQKEVKMSDADVVVRLGESLSPEQGRDLAEQVAAHAGVRSARHLSRGGGRLLHVVYRPGVLWPSGVAAVLYSLGRDVRLAAL